MPSVLEINDVAQLAGSRLLWNRLLPQTRNATFFQSLDWLEAYWRHYGSGQELRVLVIASASERIGILPLVVRTERTRLGPIRVLGYPLDDWSVFYGPIGPNPTASLVVAMAYLRRARREWDMLDLRHVDASRCDHGRTPQAMRLAGFHPHKQAWACGAVVEMHGTWEDYWHGLPTPWRHEVRRCRQRLSELGAIRHVRYRPEGKARGDGDPRWDLFESCLRIAPALGQPPPAHRTVLCQATACGFLRDLHEAAAAAGALDLNLLLLDGAPVAFACHLHYQGRITALGAGEDPRYAALGVGTELERMVLEDSFRRGDRLYDFGAAPSEQSRNWQTSAVTSFRYTHFPVPSPRANLLRITRWFQEAIGRWDRPRPHRMAAFAAGAREPVARML